MAVATQQKSNEHYRNHMSFAAFTVEFCGLYSLTYLKLPGRAQHSFIAPKHQLAGIKMRFYYFLAGSGKN